MNAATTPGTTEVARIAQAVRRHAREGMAEPDIVKAVMPLAGRLTTDQVRELVAAVLEGAKKCWVCN